jgi:hypothetical protein
VILNLTSINIGIFLIGTLVAEAFRRIATTALHHVILGIMLTFTEDFPKPFLKIGKLQEGYTVWLSWPN